MKPSRTLAILLGVLFLAWIAWLGLAVANKGKNPILSRAQLAAATHWVVADVDVDASGQPATLKIREVLKGSAVEGSLEVLNLSAATPPGQSPFPGPGVYLLPLVGDGKTFRIAGLPRSPGVEPQSPSRPAIYPWNEALQAQLRGAADQN